MKSFASTNDKLTTITYVNVANSKKHIRQKNHVTEQSIMCVSTYIEC